MTRSLHDALAPVLFIGTGLLVGFVINRWWAVVLALLPFSWGTATVSKLEVPSLWFGIVFGAMSAFGLLLGVGTRRFLSRWFVFK